MRVMKEVRIFDRNSVSCLNRIFVKRSTDPHTGIDVVRNRIKGFAQKKVTLPQGRHKLVILDEADR
jgi:DNA polymerase III delta prime subunit